jgi:translation initiation factor 1
VTIVEKLALPAKELERWCKDLKQALGVGGVIEEDAIVLQGDLRGRLQAVLEKLGVQKITMGS